MMTELTELTELIQERKRLESQLLKFLRKNAHICEQQLRELPRVVEIEAAMSRIDALIEDSLSAVSAR